MFSYATMMPEVWKNKQNFVVISNQLPNPDLAKIRGRFLHKNF